MTNWSCISVTYPVGENAASGDGVPAPGSDLVDPEHQTVTLTVAALFL